MYSLVPCTLETRLRPQVPMPTIAARIMNSVPGTQLSCQLDRLSRVESSLRERCCREARGRRAGDPWRRREHDANLGKRLVVTFRPATEDHPVRLERALGAVAELVDVAVAQRRVTEAREHSGQRIPPDV